MSKLFPDEPSLNAIAVRPRPALFVIAAVHALLGGYGLVRAGMEDFQGAWWLAAAAAPVLLAHAVLLAFRRRPFVYSMSQVLVWIFRVGGGGTIMVGAMAMREHMDGAYEVMGVGLVVGLWGVWLGSLLEDNHLAFAVEGELSPAVADAPVAPASLAPLPAAAVTDLLVERLGRDLGAMSRFSMRVACGMLALFGGMGLLFGLGHGAWDVAAVVGGFGVALGVVLWLAARRTAPERMRPVLDHLRHEPERITSIRHYAANQERGYMIRHFVEVKTATHRLVTRADDDWPHLMTLLAERCPRAARQD